MEIIDVNPKPNEIVSVRLNSAHLLASRCHSDGLMLSAGTLPDGCISMTVHLPDNDYSREIKAAIVDTVSRINRKWRII